MRPVGKVAAAWSGAASALLLLVATAGRAQQAPAATPPTPPPFTAPDSPLPDVTHAPGQQSVPTQQPTNTSPNQTTNAPDAPLPQADKTTVDMRSLKPLSPQPPTPALPSAAVAHAANSTTRPGAEASPLPNTHLFNFIGAYRAPTLPPFSANSPQSMDSLIRDGKLYLSLRDAIVLAVQNNLDVEVSRYNLFLAETDLQRAQGGGNLRGLDYTLQETPPGVGLTSSPLLITGTAGNASSTNASITDLSQVTQTGSSTQQNLSQNGTFTYSPGPPLPFYDPTLTAQSGYFRRSNQISLLNASGTNTASTSSATGTTDTTAPLSFLSAGVDYQQGFSTGAQFEVYADNAAQVLYANSPQYNPFHAPSASFTLTQPLLRGRGRALNLRFVRIARLDVKASRLIFEQQLLDTIYGVSRLYYDLVSLGENIGVKEVSLAAAERLYQDDKSQVDEGTLAPVELTRAQALRSSSRLDLIQARGQYRQQEVILRQQLERVLSQSGLSFASIIPTDRIAVPDNPPALEIAALIEDALSNRPDLAQAALQVKADEISASATRNGVKPLLNVYANVETRGASLAPFQQLGSTGTGAAVVPPELTQGGLRLSTIYQGGVQLNMTLRNRIAQADAARDIIQLRQAQARSAKLENDIRQQIENAAIALDTAHDAYSAAVEGQNYQQQLLQAEIDKVAVGASTNFLIVQDQAYLAQARSTEVAARSDWMKARLSLDRALGNLLEKNNIVLDDAIREQAR